MTVKNVSAIVLISKNIDRLKEFYEYVFGLDFKEETHGQLKRHFVTVINGCRLILHNPDMYNHLKLQQGRLSLFFSVSSIQDVTSNLKKKGIEITNSSRERFGQTIEFKDVDGNIVHAVALSTR